MDGPGAPHDRISALPDDLLHVILTFLGVDDAAAVTRTAVLSRRWRHMWIHAKSLSFYDDHLKHYSVPGHLAGFVDWALAQRGDVDMESLKIYFYEKDPTSPEQVNEWLRYAARRVVKSVDVHLGESTDPHAAVELPGHGRMTSISLFLWNRRLQLPSNAGARSYEALTELSLAFLSLTNGAGSTQLGDFVSSCCPRLRRLHISLPEGLLRLVLRSEALENLDVFGAGELRMLDVTAPNLGAIRLASCFHIPMAYKYDVKKVARIVAPRLQELEISFILPHGPRYPRPQLDIHDLTSVRRLNNLVLDIHGKYCHGNNDVGLSLLAKCPRVEHVEVALEHLVDSVVDKGYLIDLTTEGVAAQFAKVRSMDVDVYFFPASHLVASIASLLTRCTRLRSLSVGIATTQATRRCKCFCDDLEDKLKIHRSVVLEMLEDVIITGFKGADEQMKLLSLFFESSNSIKCMALSETPGKIDIAALTQKIGKEVESNNTLLQKLMKTPCADRGHWHFVEQVFVWTCDATERFPSIAQRKMY